MASLHHAFRQFAKAPGFTATAVAILAIGIGANTALFSVVNALMLRPLPYDKPEQIVIVYENLPSQGIDRFSVAGPKYIDWRRQNTVFQEMGAVDVQTFTLSGAGEPAPVATCRVTPSCLRLWSFRPQLGRLFEENEDQTGRNQVLILSHRLWQKRFGGRTDVMGETVRLDSKPYTIVGVLPAGGIETWEGGEVAFVPLPAPVIQDGPGVHYYQVFGRLNPGISLERARIEMTALADRLRAENRAYGDWGVTLFSFREEQLREWPGWQTIVLLQGAVLLVLLVACANMANLLLARGIGRRREIGIRLAMGATRWRIVRQLLVESVCLALVGGAAGTLLASWSIDAANSWLGSEQITLWTPVRMDRSILLFSIAASAVTGVAFGIVPAWQSTRVDIVSTLKSTGAATAGSLSHRRTLSWFVATEIALAVLLGVTAGLFVYNLSLLWNRSPGFDPAGVLVVDVALPEARYAKAAQRDEFVTSATSSIGSLPGARSAAAANMLPMGGSSTWDMWVIGRKREPGAATTGAELRRISPTYFETLGVRLLRGRGFTPADRSGAESVAVINETLARRYFPDSDPIGAHLGTGDGIASPHTIIGIVADERPFGLTSTPVPTLYVPTAQGWFRGASPNYSLALAVRLQGDPLASAKAVEARLRSIDPEIGILGVRSMERWLSGSLLSQRLTSFTLAAFAIMALLLSALGVYGVTANAVSHRTNEIGVRMALGADQSRILRMVVGEGLKFAALGIAVGLAGALAVSRLIQSFLHDVNATDPWVQVLVAGTVAITATVACFIPARRATRINPVEALRAE